MVSGLIIVGVAIVSYLILKRFFGRPKEDVSSNRNRIIVWICIVLSLAFIFIMSFWGMKRPGVIFERGEYKGLFYVYLYPNDQRVKSFRVDAMIYSFINSHDEGDGRSSSERRYGIEYALMPNGGKVTFNNSGDFENLRLDKIVRVRDDVGRWWGVQLTNNEVKEAAK